MAEVWSRFDNAWMGLDRNYPDGWLHRCSVCQRGWPRMYSNGKTIRCTQEELPEEAVDSGSCRDDLRRYKRRQRRLPPPQGEIDVTLIQIYGLSNMINQWQNSPEEGMLDVWPGNDTSKS